MMGMTVEQAEALVEHTFDLWLLIDDPDVELGVEMLLGKLIACDQSDEIQLWLAQKLMAGMCRG